jgi:hypothetical protein
VEIMASERLERKEVTKDWIERYREEHKSRAQEVCLKGGLVKPRHPHWNLPYCNICDRDFEVGDESYLLYVGEHEVRYHIDCILHNLDTDKVKNIVSQDRGYRERLSLRAYEDEVDIELRSQFFCYMINLFSF